MTKCHDGWRFAEGIRSAGYDYYPRTSLYLLYLRPDVNNIYVRGCTLVELGRYGGVSMAGFYYGKRKRDASGASKMFKKRRSMPGSGRRLGGYAARYSVSRFAKKRPARLRGSRVQYALNRAVGRVLNGIAENKLVSVTPQNEVAAIPIQALAQAHYQSFVVGGRPTTWDSNMNNLAGTTLAQGTADGNRIGDSVYMRKTHLTLRS